MIKDSYLLPKPETQNPKPQTLNTKHQTPNPNPLPFILFNFVTLNPEKIILLLQQTKTTMPISQKICTLIGIAIIATAFNANAQNSCRAEGEASLEGLTHSGKLAPLWHTALQEGRWNNRDENQMLATAKARLQWLAPAKWLLSGKAEIDHLRGADETYLHTGYLKINKGAFVFSAGKHMFSPVFTQSNSGSGSYLFAPNYRPVPRITLQMPDYRPVPYTQERLETRGGISQAWLSNHKAGGEVLLHEKYAYLRWNGGKWKPYTGLNHSVLFGGPGIPVDFWPTFTGTGSEKIGGGEATNAAGAHMGLYDFGTYLNTKQGIFHIYYQIPFSDGSGMLFWHNNTDHILGIDWKPSNLKWLNNLTVEWLQTTYQSGNGMPDPGIPGEMSDNGHFIHYRKLSADDMFELSGIHKENWTEEEKIEVLEKEVNHDNDFGGRDGYMNNGMYPTGWAHEGYIMGNPLNLTQQQLLAAHPEMDFSSGVNIKNDRFKAIHLGATGSITSSLFWKTKITYSRNFGTYFEQYPGRYTWNEKEDYWFKGGRNQWYTMIETRWIPPALKNLTLSLGVSADRGEIFNATGAKVGVVYNLN